MMGCFSALSRFVQLLFVAVFLSGCISEHNSRYAEVNPEGWDSAASIRLDNTDTMAFRSVSLYLRYRPSRALATAPLVISTTAPDGTCARDTVALLRNLRGRHVRWSSTQYLDLPYRSDVVWSQVGEYLIEITPLGTIKEVELIGVKIEGAI